ncbi:MAG: magnesium transporter CorA family protein [Candidatus Edwardsbacteria bacterium]|nr:magnesium transporter CorA family protein [Candidatus Edwardsbacteria bacterium]
MCERPQNDCPVRVYVNPDDAEKKQLIGDYHVDEHTLSSALDPDEQARLEFEPEHVALILKRPKNYSARDQFLFKTTSFGMFLFRDKLIIVVAEDVPLFEGKQFARVNSINELCLKLIYRSIFHFIEHLKIINMVSDVLETKINASMENKYLLNLFTLEKSLVYYLNAINSNSTVIDKLKVNAAKIGLSQEEQEYLEDIIIENNQCYKQSEIYSTVLAGLMDARVSIVSNNLNVLMKTLNIVVIGIMVPTLVVSVFSMNVRIPLAGHHYAFWMIMGLAMISVIGLMLFWRFKKW